MHCDATAAQQQGPQLGSSCKPSACQRNQASCWLQPPLLYLGKETECVTCPFLQTTDKCAAGQEHPKTASTEVGEVETC